MSILSEIRAKRDQINALGAEYGYSNFRVFGSVARGEERPDSDIDLLADYQTPSDPGKQGWGVMNFYADLGRLLGRKVAVVSEKSARPILLKYIRDDLVALDESR